MTAWSPEGFSLTPAEMFRATATDVESENLCRQYAYVKTRHGAKVSGAHGWTLQYDRDDIPLKKLFEALQAFHSNRRVGRTDEDARKAAVRYVDDAHSSVKRFLIKAIDNYLDFLESREEELGFTLWYMGYDLRARVTSNGQISYWGPTYRSEDGYIEVHRVRLKHARTAVTRWAELAGYAAARIVGPESQSVTVVEVGLFSNRGPSDAIVLDRVHPRELSDRYRSSVRPRALELFEGADPSPGRNCASCKALAACNALIPMDGVLHQIQPGPYTRSISATDLHIYDRCPARWHMERKLNLPPDLDAEGYGEEAERGRAVHRWLRIAHARPRPCSLQDLPELPDRSSQDVAFEEFDDATYATIRPFLLHHIEQCPISHGVELTLLESPLYGWDLTADTVVVSAPDAIYLRGTNLVVRETKTTKGEVPLDANRARDGFEGIVYWLLMLLDGGWVDRYGCTEGIVELEVLTPQGAALFSYHTSDDTVMLIAETRVSNRVGQWHYDTEWKARPSALCTTCPMAIWCPDAASEAATATSPSGERPAPLGVPF
ncbi:PD-(D/E)XK nuclease family protein [Micromonospora parva]|uniref:PD-(D/E)XK nuclease family protein n=1 Tax=Micromonospora parva TaxID=1464048 RepID=UPI0037F9EF08